MVAGLARANFAPKGISFPEREMRADHLFAHPLVGKDERAIRSLQVPRQISSAPRIELPPGGLLASRRMAARRSGKPYLGLPVTSLFPGGSPCAEPRGTHTGVAGGQ